MEEMKEINKAPFNNIAEEIKKVLKIINSLETLREREATTAFAISTIIHGVAGINLFELIGILEIVSRTLTNNAINFQMAKERKNWSRPFLV